MLEKWEYRIIYVNAEKSTPTGLPEDINAMFDQYGHEGWELVSATPMEKPQSWLGSPSQTRAIVCFFKRRMMT